MNGIIRRNQTNTQIRLETYVCAKWNKKRKISLVLTSQTNICEVANDPDRCVVFLNGEHVIITENYKEINSIIKELI